MEFATIIEVISTLGFPIAACIGLAWFAFYMVKKTNETNAANMEKVQERCKQREDKLYEEIKANREVNAQAIATIAHYAEKLDVIQLDIHNIQTDITVIKERQQS